MNVKANLILIHLFIIGKGQNFGRKTLKSEETMSISSLFAWQPYNFFQKM